MNDECLICKAPLEYLNADEEMVEYAHEAGARRVELYT